MSKNRYIDTRFWHDTFIREVLNPLDRYLFLYFLTNDKTNICGIYENPISTVANETGIDKEMLLKMIKRLEGKIHYIDGWVYIKNFKKYQNCNSPKIKTGIEAEQSKIPLQIKQEIEKINQLYGIDTPSYGIDTQSHLNINSNSNSNSNINSNPNCESEPQTVNEIKEIIDYLNLKANRNYSYTNKAYNRIINARLKEKKAIDDFKRVIDIKLKDPYFIKNPVYFNPETLFRESNMEKYLNSDTKINDIIMDHSVVNKDDPFSY